MIGIMTEDDFARPRMIIRPDSDLGIILQFLYYQEEINLNDRQPIRQKTIFPFEKWIVEQYIARKAGMTYELFNKKFNKELIKLEEDGYIKKNGLSKYLITLKGKYWGYNLFEYNMQVNLRGLEEFFDIDLLIKAEDGSCIKLLDIGCGAGMGLKAMMAACRDMNATIYPIGVDQRLDDLLIGKHLDNQVEESRSGIQTRPISFVQGDGMQLPFAGNSLDAVFSKAVLFYVHRNRFIQEVWRVLKSGGRLVLITSSYRFFLTYAIHLFKQGKILSAAHQLAALLNGLSLQLLGKQWYIRNSYFYAETPKSLSKALERQGFRVSTCQYQQTRFGINPIIAIASKP